jgi:hypothetical protein
MGLLDKDQWKKQPQAMLIARATAEVCRWVASDAVMGMPYAAEELQDERIILGTPIARRLTAAELTGPPARPVDEPAPELVTREQQKHMFALWGELGLGDKEQRSERLAETAKILELPELATFNDLTAEQAGYVIAELQARKAEATR